MTHAALNPAAASHAVAASPTSDMAEALPPAASTASAAPPALHVHWLRGAAALQQALPAWRALWQADAAADLFASPEWLAWLLESFGAGGPAGLALHQGPRFEAIATGPWQLRVAVVTDEAGDWLATWPLVATTGHWRGAMRPLLASPLNFHAPRSGLTARRFDAAIARRLVQALRDERGWQLLLPGGLPLADGRAALLQQALAEAGLVADGAQPWPSAWLPFEGSFGDYIGGPEQAHFRRSLVKSRNGLAREGELQWQCLAGAQALAEGLPAFLAVDAASWKAEGGESVGRDAALSARYTALCHRLAEQGWLEVWLLRQAGRPIAAFLCPNDGRRRYTLKSSFVDGVGGNRSPTLVLLHGLVQQAWEAWDGRAGAGIDFVGKVAFLDRWARQDLMFSSGVWWRSPWRRRAVRLQGLWRRLRGVGGGR